MGKSAGVKCGPVWRRSVVPLRSQPLQNLTEPLHHLDRHLALNTIPEPSAVDSRKLLLDDVDYAIAKLRLAPLHHAPAGSSDPIAQPLAKSLLLTIAGKTAVDTQSTRPSCGSRVSTLLIGHAHLGNMQKTIGTVSFGGPAWTARVMSTAACGTTT